MPLTCVRETPPAMAPLISLLAEGPKRMRNAAGAAAVPGGSTAATAPTAPAPAPAVAWSAGSRTPAPSPRPGCDDTWTLESMGPRPARRQLSWPEPPGPPECPRMRHEPAVSVFTVDAGNSLALRRGDRGASAAASGAPSPRPVAPRSCE